MMNMQNLQRRVEDINMFFFFFEDTLYLMSRKMIILKGGQETSKPVICSDYQCDLMQESLI